MNDMTQEEKAKRYDDALEAVKSLREVNPSDEGIQNWVNENFPELKESEGEKIRKAIYIYLDWLDGRNKDYQPKGVYTISDMLAWIEKKGDKDSQVKLPTFTFDDVLALQNCMETAKKVQEDKELYEQLLSLHERLYDAYWLEKQGEQKKGIEDAQTSFDYANSPIVVRQGFAPKSATEAIKVEKADNTNNVEPKFKVGKWYQCIKDFFGKGVTFDKNTAYYCAKEGCLQNEYGCHIAIVKDLYDNFKLWTIADAKDGDLIYVSTEDKGIHAIFHEYKNYTIFFHCYSCGDFVQGGYMPIGIVELVRPLQKTHYNRFFEKMHEAAYEWDAEKKELRKIDPKPAWSEENEKEVNNLYVLLDQMVSFNMLSNKDATEFKDLLKSLRSQNRWKPSDEQMKALRNISVTGCISYAGQGQELLNLYNDLKKLKE